MKHKSFGAWVLKMVTNLVMAILLLVLRILRSPLTLWEELSDEDGPFRAPAQRRVAREDFNSPEEFIAFLKAKVKEVWNLRVGRILFALWQTVLRILKSPADSLDDFYDNIEDPNYDPTNLRTLSKNFFAKARGVLAKKTLVGRVAYRIRHRKAIQPLASEQDTEDVDDQTEVTFHPENLSHP